jgi:serine/threonine protein kinase
MLEHAWASRRARRAASHPEARTCLAPVALAKMSSDPFGLVGSTIAGRFAVEAVVGEGGFSVVYRARHTLWNRPVAIKALRGFEAADAEVRERLLQSFVQEGAILAELSERTTAIVQARDTATLLTPGGDWVPYLVLEWLEGESLESVLWQERRVDLPPRDVDAAVDLLTPIAQALALAHAKGICHRDLKPGNVFVLGDPRARDCTVKLLDFGVASFFGDARRTMPRRPVAAHAFTPSYAAPEQFSSAYGISGPWTDVFALALMFVELVAGREPIGDGPTEQLARIVTDPLRRPTPWTLGARVPDEIERVVARALSVYPAERWQTAGSFWQALRDAMRASPAVESAPQAEPPPSSAAGPSGSPSSRAPRIAPAAAIVLALALAASAASDHHVERATVAARRAVPSSSR